MKNLIILSFLLLSFLDLSATIIRVNNNPGATAEYSSLIAAYTASNSGDTIHIEPSSIDYGWLNGSYAITKQLTFIGNGYFLDENLGLQSNTEASTVGLFEFKPGSENSVVMGLTIDQGISIYTSDIKIIRNNLINAAGIGLIADSLSNIFVLQNYQALTAVPFFNDNSYYCSNIYMLNNITSRDILINSSSAGIFLINNILTIDGINGTININNAVIRNNILVGGSFTYTNSVVENNLCNSTQFPDADGNQQNVDMNNVFQYTGSTDGQFQLLMSSPASGAGYYAGEDCGAYDVPPGIGYVPYKLSGIPSIPSIYELSATTSNDTLNVIISTRSNN